MKKSKKDVWKVAFDAANEVYAGHITRIINDIKNGVNNSGGEYGSLGDISRRVTDVCAKIYVATGRISRTVQCLSIL